MLGATDARERALAVCTFDDVVVGPAHELDQGWYFPLVAKRSRRSGVIVNKQTGRTLTLFAGSSVDLDLTLYDRGYQFSRYDLVVHAVRDLEETVRVIHAMRCGTTDPYYSDGRVWRNGRPLPDGEVRRRLTKPPAIFPCLPVFCLEELERAREADWFTFEALEGGTW